VAPGICDGISARCALEAGFNCLYQRSVYLFPVDFEFYLTIALIAYISGAATTASRLGQPDLAIATLNDFVEVTYFNILTTI
jgi:2-methylisocitrate lyase-like PEP mutase family enzyme